MREGFDQGKRTYVVMVCGMQGMAWRDSAGALGAMQLAEGHTAAEPPLAVLQGHSDKAFPACLSTFDDEYLCAFTLSQLVSIAVVNEYPLVSSYSSSWLSHTAR